MSPPSPSEPNQENVACHALDTQAVSEKIATGREAGLTAAEAGAIRDGVARMIDANVLVPGDKVPADLRLIEIKGATPRRVTSSSIRDRWNPMGKERSNVIHGGNLPESEKLGF